MKEFRQAQILAFECSVCRQLFDEDNRVLASTVIKLFGQTDPYKVCCCCGQEVDTFEFTVSELNSYYFRWRRWLHRLIKERKSELRRKMREARERKVD